MQLKGSDVLEDFRPLPHNFRDAAHNLAHSGIRPGIVGSEAENDYESVTRDLNLWTHLLQPGEANDSDDYIDSWLALIQAVNCLLLVRDSENVKFSLERVRFRKSTHSESRVKAREISETSIASKLVALQCEHQVVINTRRCAGKPGFTARQPFKGRRP